MSVLSEDYGSASPKGDHGIAIGHSASCFHPRRSYRHPCNRKSAHTSGSVRQHTPHVGYRNMTFKGYPINNRGMAGGQIGRQADPALKCCAVCIVDNSHIAAESPFDLRGPFFAASASRIAAHDDVCCGKCRGGNERKHQDQFPHSHVSSTIMCPPVGIPKTGIVPVGVSIVPPGPICWAHNRASFPSFEVSTLHRCSLLLANRCLRHLKTRT